MLRIGYKMAHVLFDKVCVDFPIFNSTNRSFKNTFMQIATGGRIDFGADKTVIRSLDNISFEINSGDRIGLIGHNGAGKSTLLRTLAGVYEPTAGKLSVSGEVGAFVDISLGIDKEATGRENILIRGELLGMTSSEIRKKFDNIVSFSELGEFIDMPVRTYSSGMCMRLAFSVLAETHPEIILMDEWLSVGDEKFSSKAQSKLMELVNSSSILVLASHSRSLIEKMCTKVLWLEHGAVVMQGEPREVCSKYWKK